MERTERGRTEPRAGLDLIDKLRENRIDVPVLVYCSPGSVERYSDELLAAGAAAVTASPLELFSYLAVPTRSEAGI